MEEELRKAKNEMDFARHFGGHRYKQAKAHYERLLRRAKWNNTTK